MAFPSTLLRGLLPVAFATLLPALAAAQSPRPVTLETFNRAETDHYFGTYVRQGALGRFLHTREVVRLDRQDVVRMNRDTLYSFAIIDLDAGPATVHLPDTGGRFLSLLAIDQDHFNPVVFYAPGQRTFTRAEIGTRYVGLVARTFLDPNDAADTAAAHAAQDGLRVEQPGGPGRFEVPEWDRTSQDALRGILERLTPFVSFSRAFGARGQVDPVAHVVGTAGGWGGNPPAAAVYQSIFPPAGETARGWRIRLADVPVDGFWSITVYNERGFMEPNPRNLVSVNNVTAQRGADGAVTVQVGACEAATPNCIPAPANWNGVLRLYRPRAEVLDGTWRTPALEPVT
jgi:hypothetical protein